MAAECRLFAVGTRSNAVGGELNEVKALIEAARRAQECAAGFLWHSGDLEIEIGRGLPAQSDLHPAGESGARKRLSGTRARSSGLRFHCCGGLEIPPAMIPPTVNIATDDESESPVTIEGSCSALCGLALPHLHARVCGADESVDDAWMLAACTLAATRMTNSSNAASCGGKGRKYSNNSESTGDGEPCLVPVVAWLCDGDGSFLLIEAAMELPEWAEDADCTAGRVWVHNGRVHLVSPPRTPAELGVLPPLFSQTTSASAFSEREGFNNEEGAEATKSPGAYPRALDDLSAIDVTWLEQVLSLVCNEYIDTLAPLAVERAIMRRCGPEALSKLRMRNRHVAHCYLPVRAACLLHSLPGVAACGVRALAEHAMSAAVTGSAGRSADDASRLMSFGGTIRNGLSNSSPQFAAAEPANFAPSICDSQSNRHNDPARSQTFLTVSVRFSRLLFAMLEAQRFATPLAFPPRPRDVSEQIYDRGVKLTAGLEMWLSTCRRRPQSAAAQENVAVLAMYFIQQFNEGSDTSTVLHFPAPAIEDSTDWMIVSPEEVDALMLGRTGTHEFGIGDDGDGTGLCTDRDLDGGSENRANRKTGCGADIVDDALHDFERFVEGTSSTGGIVTHAQSVDFDADEILKILADGIASPGNSRTAYINPEKQFPSESGASNEASDFARLMSEMDAELDALEVSHAQANGVAPARSKGRRLSFDVDVVENLVESFVSQHGLPGPVSNILGELRA